MSSIRKAEANEISYWNHMIQQERWSKIPPAGGMQDTKLGKMEDLADSEKYFFTIPKNPSREELLALQQLTRYKTTSQDEAFAYARLLVVLKKQLDSVDPKDTSSSGMCIVIDASEKAFIEKNLNKQFLESKYSAKIPEIQKLKIQVDDTKFDPIEIAFINEVCRSLVSLIETHVYMANTNEAEFKQGITSFFEDVAAQAQKLPHTTGIRGFLNDLCEALNLEPFFTIKDSATISKLGLMKDTTGIKTETTEQKLNTSKKT